MDPLMAKPLWLPSSAAEVTVLSCPKGFWLFTPRALTHGHPSVGLFLVATNQQDLRVAIALEEAESAGFLAELTADRVLIQNLLAKGQPT